MSTPMLASHESLRCPVGVLAYEGERWLNRGSGLLIFLGGASILLGLALDKDPVDDQLRLESVFVCFASTGVNTPGTILPGPQQVVPVCSIFDIRRDNHGFTIAGTLVSSTVFCGAAKSVARRPQAAAKDNHNPGTARFPVT